MKNYVFLLSLIFMLILSGCTTIKEKESTPTAETQSNQTVASESTSTEKKSSPALEEDLKGVDENMEHILNFLSENNMVHMATVGTDGKPSNRTIQFQFYENGRIYFQTDTNASLYRDLKKVPYMELVANNKDNTQSLRIRGEVVFEYNRELLERTLLSPNIKNIYGSTDNPILTMFYIDHGTAQIYEFSDQKQGTIFQYMW